MDKELEDVVQFHRKFKLLEFMTPGHLTQRKLNERLDCMYEELREFAEGVFTQDLAAQADALVDLVYFAKGTACMLGLPWEELWDDVQRANMEKVRGIGHRGHPVDCIKPEGWQGPKTIEILARAGYDVKTLRKENQRDDFAENI